MSYYKKKIDDVFVEFKSSKAGLANADANLKLKKQGYNTIDTSVKISPFSILVDQFKSFIIYILIFATILSFFLSEYVDATIILIILIANALVGFYQEFSAQKSLEALKKLSVVKAKVFRNGSLKEIDSKYLVLGDIIYLEAGDKVPADSRIIECKNLKVEEASLTGESVPVEKNTKLITKDSVIGDQKNMLFASTSISEGTAKAIVVKTGMSTQIGKITQMIKEVEDEQTPLQKRLDSFGKKLGYAIIGICVLIFLVLIITAQEFSLKHILLFAMIAVSLAVAAVPEGLPAVVTVALSVGVKKLLAKKALVRKLSSVETLGSCDVIATDKTGTLTKNEMTVVAAWTLDKQTELSGIGYNPQGVLSENIDKLLFKIGMICNNASLYKEKNMWQISGDPTEGALIVSSRKANIEENYERVDEIPFDSTRKLMSVMTKEGKDSFMYTKGSPDKLLHKCSYILINGKTIKLTSKHKDEILQQNDIYASKALRVLGFAYRKVNSLSDFKEKSLVFVGLQAMIDPPRPDVIKSIAKTKKAGIRVIMITGDYKETAKAIGEEIGILGNVLTGEELDSISDEKLSDALKNNTNIFARVIPEHKQRIVRILQELGSVVAMTGDGVNDAPALKKADIGIAVGSGTDVAKEAADFVLLDDSFSHIVNAIEEGRGIYDNIQKTIMHLLSGNLSEVLIIFIAVLLGWSLPLTAIMLLWINLITDGAPALALSVDPYGDKIMNRKPIDANTGILPKGKLYLILFLGIVATIISLGMFRYFLSESEIVAQTMTFTFVVLSETVLVFLIRKGFGIRMFTNKWLGIAIGLSFGLQALILYSPLREFFEIAFLHGYHMIVLAGGGVVLYLLGSLYLKLVKNI